MRSYLFGIMMGLISIPTLATVATAEGPQASSDAEIKQVIKEIESMPPTVDRNAVVTEAVRRRWVTSDQALRLLETIPPGCSRLESAKTVHARLVDPENFYRVFKLFPDVADQQALKRFADANAQRTFAKVDAPAPTPAPTPVPVAKAEPLEEIPASEMNPEAAKAPKVVHKVEVKTEREPEPTPTPAPKAEPKDQPKAEAAPKKDEQSFVRFDVTDTDGGRVESARIYYCGKGPAAPPIDDSVTGEPWLSYGCELQVWIGERMVYNEHFLPKVDGLFERRVRVDYY